MPKHSNSPITLSLEGFDDLFAKLRTVEEKAAKPILRATMRAGAKVVGDAAKQIVPIDTGNLKADIKVRATPKRRRGQISYSVTLGNSGLFSGKTFYGGMVEYGTRFQKEQKYIRSAFDDNTNGILEACRTKLASRIEAYLSKG